MKSFNLLLSGVQKVYFTSLSLYCVCIMYILYINRFDLFLLTTCYNHKATNEELQFTPIRCTKGIFYLMKSVLCVYTIYQQNRSVTAVSTCCNANTHKVEQGRYPLHQSRAVLGYLSVLYSGVQKRAGQGYKGEILLEPLMGRRGQYVFILLEQGQKGFRSVTGERLLHG